MPNHFFPCEIINFMESGSFSSVSALNLKEEDATFFYTFSTLHWFSAHARCTCYFECFLVLLFFQAICYPLKITYGAHRSIQKNNMLAVAWILSLIFSLPQAFVYVGNESSCYTDFSVFKYARQVSNKISRVGVPTIKNIFVRFSWLKHVFEIFLPRLQNCKFIKIGPFVQYKLACSILLNR